MNHTFKVCHYSAFFIISVRSVYIKIFNYSGSILANLSNTKANKTACNKKVTLVFRFKQDILGINFVLEGYLASTVFINSISWTCIQYIFISRGAFFLRARNFCNRIQTYN